MYDYLRQHTDTNGSNFFIFRLDAHWLGDRPLFYNLKAKMYGKRKINYKKCMPSIIHGKLFYLNMDKFIECDNNFIRMPDGVF